MLIVMVWYLEPNVGLRIAVLDPTVRDGVMQATIRWQRGCEGQPPIAAFVRVIGEHREGERRECELRQPWRWFLVSSADLDR